jgi:hypothetical protein
MGAAGSKSLQSEKARHAANVLSVVKTFAEDDETDTAEDAVLFKQRVLAAAAKSKEHGHDIDDSIAQLDDEDMANLNKWIASGMKSELFPNASKAYEAADVARRAIDDGDDADEISVMSEHVMDTNDLDSSLEDDLDISAGTTGKSTGGVRIVPVEDDDMQHTRMHSITEERGNNNDQGVKVYPAYRPAPKKDSGLGLAANDSMSSLESAGDSPPSRKTTKSRFSTSPVQDGKKSPLEGGESPNARQRALVELVQDTSMEKGDAVSRSRDRIARSQKRERGSHDKSSKSRGSIWDGPGDAVPASPFPKKDFLPPTNESPGKGNYMDMGEKIDAQNEMLMDLQRQKAWSTAQNSQLQMEVEALERQLAQLDKIDDQYSPVKALKLKPPTVKTGGGVSNFSDHDTGPGAGGRGGGHVDKYEHGEYLGMEHYRPSAHHIPKRVPGRNAGAGAMSGRAPPTDGQSKQSANYNFEGGRPALRGVGRQGKTELQKPVAGSSNSSGANGGGNGKNEPTQRRQRRGPDDPVTGLQNLRLDGNAAKSKFGFDSDRDRNRDNTEKDKGSNFKELKMDLDGGRFGDRAQNEGRRNANHNRGNGKERGGQEKKGMGRRRAAPAPAKDDFEIEEVAGESDLESSLPHGALDRLGKRQGPSGTNVAVAVPRIDLGGMIPKEDEATGERVKKERGRNALKNLNRRRRNTLEEDEDKGSPPPPRPVADTFDMMVDIPVNRGPPRKPRGQRARELDGDESSVQSGNGSNTETETEADSDTGLHSDRRAAARAVRQNNRWPAGGQRGAKGAKPKRRWRAPDDAESKEKEKGDAEQSAKEAKEAKEEEEKRNWSQLWSQALDLRWAEVNLLLRRPLDSHENLLYIMASADAGLMFMEQLDEISKSLSIMRGTLIRWLLPFDNNTRLEEQSSTPGSVVENMPMALRGKLTEKQVHYLVSGANNVRKLVRIKIADDNDLEQARTALKTSVNFFKALQSEADVHSMTSFELLLKMQSSA